MSQQLKSALEQVSRALDLDRARKRLNISVDATAHSRLLARQRELIQQLASERAEEMQILCPRVETNINSNLPFLTPMGMDETMSECEKRVNFGEPIRKLPKSL